jgi:hypothetical protein
MIDPGARNAVVEAIRADVRHRVEGILDRFEQGTGELDQRERDEAFREALVGVSVVLTEGLLAQLRETGVGGPLSDSA